MIELVFTSDYELFGNGQGEVSTCMIQPTSLLMTILEDYQKRMAFFLDVCEIWAFEETKLSGHFPDEFDPAQEIKTQIVEMIQRGHDVQLHLHPQWLNYEYSDEEWKLDYKFWRLPKVEGHQDWTIEELIEKGKTYLEELIQPVKSDYKCQAFRAGAYCIQPEDKVIPALKKLGFKYDSSVLTGMKLDNGLSYYNFESAIQKPFWKIGEMLALEDNASTLTEIPIFTAKVSRIKYVDFVQKRTAMKACDCNGEPASKSLGISNSSKFEKAKSLLKQQYLIFDYCGASFEEMKFVAEKAIHLYQNSKKGVPVVLIGHPKNFNNEENLRQFLTWCKSNDAISSESAFSFSNKVVQ